MAELHSPISPSLYPFLTIMLTTGGLATTALLYVSDVVQSKHQRPLVQDVSLAAVSSVLLGFGVFFLLLWCGVYV
ncbi:hypothetical protein WJX73_007927 [Symbiochloris irregularis]|uniref:Dolichyl-diphosphooligosaccharide-protein glycosyltransferase subunit OST5 n=1 Tax=Symbiochloris irregularis TaxID=706552 RepID=A0AAW1NND4_9CHLO